MHTICIANTLEKKHSLNDLDFLLVDICCVCTLFQQWNPNTQEKKGSCKLCMKMDEE
jgi:hypothetical protein